MPGGMGRSVAEPVLADERNAAPPKAILANSLRAGLKSAPFFFSESGVFMCPSPLY
jgi:hypothetical protein